MKNENKYQSELKKRISKRFPGSIIIKTDDIQGFPDLLILDKDKWAALEVKRSNDSSHRPNQNYWVNKLNNMSFSAFINPENEEAILDDMERSFSI